MKKINNLILVLISLVSTIEGKDTSNLNIFKNEPKISENYLKIDSSNKSTNQDQLKTDINVELFLHFIKCVPKKYLTNEFFKLIRESDKSVIECDILLIDDDIVIISPKNSLQTFSEYTVKINSKIKDFLGNYIFDQNTDLRIKFLVRNGYVVIEKIKEVEIKDFVILKK